jgi:hypothetical protein
MQMRRTLRIPIFVAEKSQYRNCQWQEPVAFGRGCAGGGEAEISISESQSTELAQRQGKLFKDESHWVNGSRDAGNSPTISR